MRRTPATSPVRMPPLRGTLPTLALALVVAGCAEGGGSPASNAEWKNIAGDHRGQRYSALDQINADNFESLEVAWAWDGSEYPAVNARATPIYVDGLLISVAGEKRHTYAIDAGTGEKVWEYVEPETFRWAYSMRKNHGKGVAYGEHRRATTSSSSWSARPSSSMRSTRRHGGAHRGLRWPRSTSRASRRPVSSTCSRASATSTTRTEGMPLETGYITSIFARRSSSTASSSSGNSAEQGYNQSRRETCPATSLATTQRTGEIPVEVQRPAGTGRVRSRDVGERRVGVDGGHLLVGAALRRSEDLGPRLHPDQRCDAGLLRRLPPGRQPVFGRSLIALDVETGERRVALPARPARHLELRHAD